MLAACFGVVEASGIVGGVLIIDASTRSSRPLGGGGEEAVMVWLFVGLCRLAGSHDHQQPPFASVNVVTPKRLGKVKTARLDKSQLRHVSTENCLSTFTRPCSFQFVLRKVGQTRVAVAATQLSAPSRLKADLQPRHRLTNKTTQQHNSNNAAVSRQETSTLIGGAFLC